MRNDRKKGGCLAEMRQAIELLMNAHTRDDDRVGFTVDALPNIEMIEGGQATYIEAWRAVRVALGYQTKPETQS